MHPILLKLGPLTIHSYGALIAIGFFLALATVRRLAPRSGIDGEKAVDSAFWLMVVGFIGARALFVVTRWSDYMADPLSIFKIWEGGLVFFGGPMVAIPWSIWWFRKNRIPFWSGIDVFLPALVIAHSLGRLGCLAAGCCYGRPTESGWGVRLHSELVEPALRGVPLHPVQLYESAALLVLFGGLLWLHRHRKFDGQVGITYLLTYPVIRSLIETFRGDSIRGFVIEGLLSTSQFISILFVAAGTWALLVRRGQLRQAGGK